jgi:hypothetical protein
MKPNLIDVSVLDIDFKKFIFRKNSKIINITMIAILLFSIWSVLFIFKPNRSKIDKRTDVLSSLHSILEKSSKYSQNSLDYSNH